MLFCTQQFLYFFAIIFAVYWSLPWQKARVWLLLGASYYFYASWNPLLARLIFITTAADYLFALGIAASATPARKRCLLVLSLVMNVGLLVYFKYANFFLQSLSDALHAAGSASSLPLLTVIAPIGISFYTFEAISYMVDVYRGRLPAERNLPHFMLFILFFPHLVAGPIVRARDFLPQVRRRKHWSWPRFALGGQLILLGMFKKFAIADRMALLVDPVFKDPTLYSTGVLWMAAVAYAFQVYCDFSGYSDLALGTAHMLGYRLAVNFDMPFASANVAEFWRRWHISLSNWIRDYIFFPLGGSRGGEWKTARNIFIAMTLCGLWHGPKWPMVAWGMVNAFYMIVHRWFRAWAEPRPRLNAALQTRPGTTFRIGLTFATFVLALVVFRTQSLGAGAAMMGRMFVAHSGLTSPVAPICFWVTAWVMLAAHLLGGQQWTWRVWERLPPPVRGFGYASCLVVSLFLAPVTSQAFIYFDF